MAYDSSHRPELDDSENDGTNPSGNRPSQAVLQASMSRRAVVKGSFAVTATSVLALAATASGFGTQVPQAINGNGPLVGSAPLTAEQAALEESKNIAISSGYEYDTLIPRGTPITPFTRVNGRRLEEYTGDPNTLPTPEEQEQMVGLGHDATWFFPGNQRAVSLFVRFGFHIPGSSRRGMRCIDHEFARNDRVFGLDENGVLEEAPANPDDVRLSQAAPGVSVVAIYERRGRWRVGYSRNSRRITVNTRVTFSGPAANSSYLENVADNNRRPCPGR